MNQRFSSIDLTKVQTIIYHMPDGKTLNIRIHTIEQLLDLDLDSGNICDTSDIDGVVHFFPHGIA